MKLDVLMMVKINIAVFSVWHSVFWSIDVSVSEENCHLLLKTTKLRGF